MRRRREILTWYEDKLDAWHQPTLKVAFIAQLRFLHILGKVGSLCLLSRLLFINGATRARPLTVRLVPQRPQWMTSPQIAVGLSK